MGINNLKTTIGLMLLSSLAACSALQTTPQASIEHTNPQALTVAGMSAWSNGDTGTAAVLLHRAALLAPYDATIQHNLQRFEQTRGMAKPPPVSSATRTTSQATGVDSDTKSVPPMMNIPLWPRP